MTEGVKDEGLEWLREDQRSSGLTIEEYERKYGVILGSGDRPMGRARDIRRHEVSLGEGHDRLGATHHCAACAPRDPTDS
jgi:hypothetical protein